MLWDFNEFFQRCWAPRNSDHLNGLGTGGLNMSPMVLSDCWWQRELFFFWEFVCFWLLSLLVRRRVEAENSIPQCCENLNITAAICHRRELIKSFRHSESTPSITAQSLSSFIYSIINSRPGASVQGGLSGEGKLQQGLQRFINTARANTNSRTFLINPLCSSWSPHNENNFNRMELLGRCC